MEERAVVARTAGQEEYAAAEKLLRENAVRPMGTEEGELVYSVGRKDRLIVRLRADESLSGRCGCGKEGVCRHLAAALLEALSSGRLEVARRQKKLAAAARLRREMDDLLPQGGTLQLQPRLQLPDEKGEEVRVSLRAGQERLYVVRSLWQFLTALEEGREITFGKSCTLELSWGGFSEADRALLQLLCDAERTAEVSGMLARTGAAARFLAIPERMLPRLLQLLEKRPFRLSAGEKERDLPGIPEGRVNLSFSMGLRGREIEVRAEAPEDLRFIDRDGFYVCCAGEIIRTERAQRAALRSMDGGSTVFTFGPEESVFAISSLLPRLKSAGEVEIEGRLKDRLINRPLTARANLDRSGDAVVCRLTFHYGDAVIDPFHPREPEAESGLLMVRDAEGERRAMDVLAACGFRINGGEVALQGSAKIWRFFTEGLAQLQGCCEVWLSEAFRHMRPRRAALSGRLGMRGNVMQLELLLDGEPFEDTDGILRALREKKTWYRLPDGAFLDLAGLSDWEELADAAEGAQQPEEERRSSTEIAGYRALWLMNLLGEKNLPVEADEAVRSRYDRSRMITEPCPQPIAALLRPYQERGFAWLQSLYRLGMGGVLADDMGLGKTLQVIALLQWARERDGAQPSVIVAPTSLLYNWERELKRFAPGLKTLVAEGGPAQRERQITALGEKPGETDVYLTSYPLLRRDSALLCGVSFRFAILDEAQHIKNAASAGAGAARELKAVSHFALTGTPMENHPGELWSIFDAVLPGYLDTFARFMQRYGEGGDAEGLRRRIRPFLLRRLKKDVLADLPEKTESVLLAEMTPEQRRVYRAALQRLKPDERTLSGGGRFRVLAALTELREACGHPALILPEYAGSSGKLDLLMDILPGALESGHRALIFSQFTRMLRIIERRLEATGIESFYLDGETPARERMDRVQRFNAGEGQIFLISLKAGGAGLNLTGADWVIHYDPWWNPAAEDQATDRVHRIGQTKSVTVTRLVTRDSVEEQVVRLGERKRELFERMIEAGEAFPTQLTEEEIRALFEENGRA